MSWSAGKGGAHPLWACSPRPSHLLSLTSQTSGLVGLLLARKLIFGEQVKESVINIIDNRIPEFAPSEILSSSQMAYYNEFMESGVFGLW